MAQFQFDRALICGVGLIGGSLARALRLAHAEGRAGGKGRIIGVDRDAVILDRARALGFIDAGCAMDGTGSDATPFENRFAAEVAQADLIVLAVPVAQVRTLLTFAAAALPDAVVITDVGSTKHAICDAAQLILGEKAARFVGGHPIAGGENSGVEAGSAQLFINRDVVLCPVLSEGTDEKAPDATATAGDLPDLLEGSVAALPPGVPTAADALSRVDAMWTSVGGRTAVMTAQKHDRLFAAVSHMPHLLAFAFIEHILQSDDPAERFAFAGSGFRDFTRIAASNPEMWRDICIANRDSILAECDQFVAVLAGMRAAVAAGDAATLEAVFSRSRTSRAAWRRGEPGDPAGSGE